MQVDPNLLNMDEQFSTERATSPRTLPRHGRLPGGSGASTVDGERLAKAVQILQSELNLAGSPVSLADHTDLLSELYEILGPGGSHVDPLAMVTFHHHLAERLQSRTHAA